MSRNDLLLRDSAACVGVVFGGATFYLGLIMVAAAVIGLMTESVLSDSLGISLHPNLGGMRLAEFAVTGSLASFFGHRTYVICLEEVPETVRIWCAAAVVLSVIAILACGAFFAFEPLLGSVWAVIAAVIAWLVLVSCARTPIMFRLR